MADVKKATQSKTVKVGVGITLLSVLAIIVDVWAQLDPEQLELLDKAFGPGTMAVVGIAMIVLRAVTRNPIRWRE